VRTLLRQNWVDLLRRGVGSRELVLFANTLVVFISMTEHWFVLGIDGIVAYSTWYPFDYSFSVKGFP
jgi:hypothetical protein